MTGILRRLPGVRLTLFLLVVVAAVNAVALWGIFTARRGALETARHELALETEAHARSLEAVLATLRGDLVFLSQSPLLVRYPETASSGNPLVRRWSRLDAEAALLLFLEAHPAVHRLELRRGRGEVLLLAGRLRGAPAILEPKARGAVTGDDRAPKTRASRWRGTFPLGSPTSPVSEGEDASGGAGRGTLEVSVDPSRLLAVTAPGYGDRLRVATEPMTRPTEDELSTPPHKYRNVSPAHASPRAELHLLEDRTASSASARLARAAAEPLNTSPYLWDDVEGRALQQGLQNGVVDSRSALVARAQFADERWSPPLRGTLVRNETESRLVASVESLAGRYRTTVVLYSLVMTLTLLLGTVALGQSRKAAHLEAARRHEARVRDLERQLFHNERLASVGRLAAGVAHEINNPLEGMANYLSLLEEDLRAGRTEGVDQLTDRLRQGLDRAAGAVRQVLAFSDPARSPKVELDLGEVLTEAVEFLETSPASRGVRVELEVARPLRVRANRVTLGQLFLNLLLNACQVQKTGGEVRVRGWREVNLVRVEIADRGPGLPPELGDRIFEPFVSTRTSCGLGLAVCRGIVEEHRGEIRGFNRRQGGAAFEVTLPAAGSGGTDERRPTESTSRGRGGD